MLSSFLEIDRQQPELISMVGAGGKTSAIFQLAQELTRIGSRVLVTTTTKIFTPPACLYDYLVIGAEPPPIYNGVTVWGKEVNAEHKILGIDSKLIDQVFKQQIYDCILVEADGAHGCPVKVPADYEPVIPAATTKVVGLIGLSCLGQPASKAVHRPALWCSLTGAAADEAIGIRHLIKLVKSPSGLFKDMAEGCQPYLLLTQADNSERRQAALDIVRSLPRDTCRSLSAAMADIPSGFIEIIPASPIISGIVLASGWSRRCSSDKLLLDYRGKPLVEWVIKAACASELDEVIVVYRDSEVKAIADRYPTRAVCNPYSERGQSEAVKLGLYHINPHADGIMYLTGDQPLIDSELINHLISEYILSDALVCRPNYQREPGNPVIFSARLGSHLSKLSGDQGGRTIINSIPEDKVLTIEISDGFKGMDVDSMDDYQRLLKAER